MSSSNHAPDYKGGRFFSVYFPNKKLRRPPQIGDTFKIGRLPFHMTLMPKVADRYREYRDAFHDIANEVGAFTLHTGGTDMFGQKRNKPVRLIRPHPSLQQLHEDLLSTISDEIPLDLTRFGPNYHPHISDATFMQRNGKIDTVGFPAGQTLRFGAFAVLATQHDGLWHVVDKLHLKG